MSALLNLTRNPYIPLTIRKKIGKCMPVTIQQPYRIKIFSQFYEGTTGNHMDNKIYLYGMHESASARLMRAVLNAQKKQGKTPVYMDIGCNAGMHLTALADLVEKGFGFEPWETVREKAAHNLQINNVGHITLCPYGLSDQDAELPYQPPEQDNFGVGSFVETANDKTVILKVRKGDEVVREQEIKPTLIKMDVEGHEQKALRGLHNTITKYKPAVVYEYNDMSREELNDAALLIELFGPDYKFYGIKRSREMPALEPFNPDKKYENVFAYAGDIKELRL